MSSAATLVLFAVLEPLVVGLGRLPPDAYEQAFIAPEIVLRLVRWMRERVLLTILAASGVMLVVGAFAAARPGSPTGRRLRTLAGGWPDLHDGAALRALVGAVTGALTWVLAAYQYNAYFGRAHLADRMLLVILWVALLWRPLFVLPFVVVASAIAHQFQIPLASFSWTEAELLVRIPILLGAFWIVRSLMDERRPDGFVFLLCCLIAVTWWSSGFGKARMGWITHPHVDLLFLGAHANGWLRGLDRETVVRVADGIRMVSVPLMVATLVVECGALLLLARRWTLVGFLCLTSTFHIAAFALTGIFFWKWMVVDVAFLVFLMHRRRIEALRIFSPAHLALSVLIIVGHPAWIAAGNLSWFDTPVTYAVRLEAIDAAGAVRELPAGFFAPYTETFVLETFPYLSPHGQLTGPMGVTQDRGIARTLVAERTPAGVFEQERRLGVVRYDAARSARFDRFVARWVRTANADADRGSWAALAPPRHLWTFPLNAPQRGERDIVRVQVVELTHFFDGHSLRIIRRRPLRVIDIATGVGHPVDAGRVANDG